MEEKEREYTTVSIPIDLAEKIDGVLEKCGYRNRPDFVCDAIRRRLGEVSKGA
jgi:metal-responsive CopG/Arc/MetJ family transcriptional regulator